MSVRTENAARVRSKWQWARLSDTDDLRCLNSDQQLQFDRLLAELSEYDLSRLDGSLSARLETISTLPEAARSIADLASLERALIMVRPIAQLQALMGYYEGRAREGGCIVFVRPPVDADEGTVRQSLLALLSMLYENLTSSQALERERHWMLTQATILTFFVVVTFLLLNGLFAMGLISYMPPALIVIMAGSVGGLLSTFPQISSLSWKATERFPHERLGQARLGIAMAPVSGMCFALVLFLLFASGLVKGEPFPVITVADQQHISALEKRIQEPIDDRARIQNREVSKGIMMLLVGRPRPATGVDFAKMLVWSFLAGYATTLVPGLLNRVSSAIAKDGKREAS